VSVIFNQITENEWENDELIGYKSPDYRNFTCEDAAKQYSYISDSMFYLQLEQNGENN
jgi:hypothetical protein